MNNDSLVECRRCGGNACYESKVNETLTTWLCWGCGFTSSTELEVGNEVYNQMIETYPELYKDLIFVDNLNYGWFPSTITVPGKGMVFIDGTSKEDWRWAAVQSIEIPEDEKDKYPSDQTHKMDMANIEYFGQKGFMDALEKINFYSL